MVNLAATDLEDAETIGGGVGEVGFSVAVIYGELTLSLLSPLLSEFTSLPVALQPKTTLTHKNIDAL
jgi:hypothetical protein